MTEQTNSGFNNINNTNNTDTISNESNPQPTVHSAKPMSQAAMLMLASSNLPIGSYTYSQGVESAIDKGYITDEASTLAWLSDYLDMALLGLELPLLVCMMSPSLQPLSDSIGDYYLASRETKEFELETTQMAHAFVAWVESVLALNVPNNLQDKGFLPLFAQVCTYTEMSTCDAMQVYGFGQIENMVLAAVKTVPLGQMAGQRILWQLQQSLHGQLATLEQDCNQHINTWLNKHQHQHSQLSEQLSSLLHSICPAGSMPNLAMLSSQHEQQYSRLFRS